MLVLVKACAECTGPVRQQKIQIPFSTSIGHYSSVFFARVGDAMPRLKKRRRSSSRCKTRHGKPQDKLIWTRWKVINHLQQLCAFWTRGTFTMKMLSCPRNVDSFSKLPNEIVQKYVFRHATAESNERGTHRSSLGQLSAWHLFLRAGTRGLSCKSRRLGRGQLAAEQVKRALLKIFGPDHTPNLKDVQKVHRTIDKDTAEAHYTADASKLMVFVIDDDLCNEVREFGDEGRNY